MHSMDETTKNDATDNAYERETTINLSDGDPLVRIWSARRKDITRLRKKPEVFTEIAHGFDGTNHWAEFTCPVERFNIGAAARPKREMTDEQREATAARLKLAREKSAA